MIGLCEKNTEVNVVMGQRLKSIQSGYDASEERLSDATAKLAILQKKLESYENKNIAKRRCNNAFAVVLMAFGFLYWASFWAFRGLPLCIPGAWMLLSLVSATQREMHG